MSDSNNDAQAIIDTAFAAAQPHRFADLHLATVVVPAGANLAQLNLEHLLNEPTRKRGIATFYAAGSFATYVEDHGEVGRTAVYADIEAKKVIGVLNGHETNNADAGWGDHRAILQLRHPPAWERWIDRDDVIGTQQAFAEHIETSLGDIVDPLAADLLEMAQSFQATVKVDFKSSQFLANGQRQLRYEETINAKAGQQGNLTVPSQFTVQLQPFEGSDTYKMTARLRTRIDNGRLLIGYQLDRPEEVLRAAFDDVLTEIEETTEITPYLGTPPA